MKSPLSSLTSTQLSPEMGVTSGGGYLPSRVAAR